MPFRNLFGLLNDDDLAALSDPAMQQPGTDPRIQTLNPAGLLGGGTGPGMQRAALPPEPAAPTGIRAYHGSPHHFEQFSSEHIGTGEKAQAYGHGLYFAQNEGVAKSYRDTLAPSRAKLPDDVLSMPPDLRRAIMTQADRTDVDAMTAAYKTQNMAAPLRSMDRGKLADMIQRVRDAKRGAMYEVNIQANPEHLLDWDKPLAQQSEHVQQAMQTLGLQAQPPTVQQLPNGRWAPVGTNGNVLGRQDGWPTRGDAEHVAKIVDQSSPLAQGKSGQDLYDFFTHKHGENELAAVETLRNAGIPGIRYLDQGSRGEGKGTHNYVVFDDRLISILRKYGLAGLLGSAGALAAASQQDDERARRGLLQ